MFRTYLAHHELESHFIIIIVLTTIIIITVIINVIIIVVIITFIIILINYGASGTHLKVQLQWQPVLVSLS